MTRPGPGSDETEAAAASEPAGARSGLLFVTSGAEAGRAVAIREDRPVTLGRSPECDVPLPDTKLSRVHARVRRVGDEYFLYDNDSRNGTFVNDTRVSGYVALADGARIRLGVSTRLRFSLVDQDEERDLVELYESSRRESARVVEATSGGRARAPADGPRLVRSPAMRAVYEVAHRAAQSTISVLVLGETGAGKEVLARAIHLASPRAEKAFLALHCAALPDTLLEAELFGHEKGAFTGAAQSHPGLFESADGGTVFLDEIGELPSSVQVKLLRVLDERKVMRIGARSPRDIDVRFVAATNRDIEADAKRGAFRQDLFFRLNGVALTVPPLRERREEIRDLAMLFVAAASRGMGRKRPPAVSDDVLAALARHEWPGNVRELRNVMDRAVALCPGDVLTLDQLPPALTSPSPGTQPAGAEANPPAGSADSLRAEMDTLQKQRILAALQACGGNQTRTAEMLGMPRRTLVARLHDWGLTKPIRKRER